MIVRGAVAADYAAWLPLWEGYLAFYRATVPPETTALTWSRLLDPAEPIGAAIAERDGLAVGLVHWVFHRSTWTGGDYCYLQDLFVGPAARGGGVGRALIEHVSDMARGRGCSRVYWLTHETNTDAMRLYDRMAERSGFLQYRKLFA